ncbi:MAG: ATP-binding protein [Parasphingorhabdus sp.]|uniref:sensor histidine kinase n=1 Tax=Parasphingorhabdus sp. TaxID=2709688 RepID=UPI003299AEE0
MPRSVSFMIAMILLTLFQPIYAQILPAEQNFVVQETPSGQIVHFTEADFSFSQNNPTLDDWERRALPALWLSDEARKLQSSHISVSAKVDFDGETLKDRTIAIFTENNREQVIVSVNDIPIFRNFVDNDHSVMGWNHPYLIPLSDKLLKEGDNFITVEARSSRDHALGIGSIAIGDLEPLNAQFERQYFFRIDAPKTINWIMLLLSLFVFIMWLARRQELELLWLSLTGLVWFVRNYHFFSLSAPIDLQLFQYVTYYSIYFAVAVTLAFCAEFLKLPQRKIIIVAMLSIGVLLSLSRLFLIFANQTDMASSLMTVILFGSFLLILAHHAVRNKSTPAWLLLLLLTAAALTGIHDIGRIPNINWWNGIGFHFQPYIGFLLFLIFMLSLAKRFLNALSLVEETNVYLEKRVTEATDALAASQHAQRQMEVERALETERERLMREMHDGIGSNLVTALAVARQRNYPSATITTLQKAISDLKITVDSLAPIDGDVVTLIANLRHRMEHELQQAGIASIWKVEECEPLVWMDAGHSLHLLRLLQEALSNILQHANAGSIILSCHSQARDSKEGILISIIDDGVGFTAQEKSTSKGLDFMYQRAAILKGALTISNEKGGGTAVRLWLAQNRQG